VVIITRPPEIVACLKLKVHKKVIFVIFDSHARPSYPDGAGFILNTSINGTAARLSEILPVDGRLLSDGDLQWQAQLLANYSGHIFVARDLNNDPAQLTQAVIKSSLDVLTLRAEVSDLSSRNSMLMSETTRLEEEMEKMEEEHREELEKFLRSSRNHKPCSRCQASASPSTNNSVAGSQVAPYQPPANSHQTDKHSRPSTSQPSLDRQLFSFPLWASPRQGIAPKKCLPIFKSAV